jgi:hypothetical protein
MHFAHGLADALRGLEQIRTGEQARSGRGSSICSRSMLVTAWVIARLPAVCSTNTRSPGFCRTVVLRKVLMWSTPALVRESDRKTSPVSSSMATQ